jgi:uncharacterized protein (TIGR04255 family)
VRDAVRRAGITFDGAVEPLTAHSISVSVGGDGPPGATSQQQDGVRLLDAKSLVEITVLPGVIAVHCTQYTRWSTSFAPIIEAAVGAVGDIFAPQVRSRVGLRYINRLTDGRASDPRVWASRLADPLAAVLAEGPFANLVRGAQQQLDLSLNERVAATVRHGCFREAGAREVYNYLLDIDVFDQNGEAFDVPETMIVAEDLNRIAAQLFRKSLSTSYADELGLHPVEASSKDRA